MRRVNVNQAWRVKVIVDTDVPSGYNGLRHFDAAIMLSFANDEYAVIPYPTRELAEHFLDAMCVQGGWWTVPSIGGMA